VFRIGGSVVGVGSAWDIRCVIRLRICFVSTVVEQGFSQLCMKLGVDERLGLICV
jgi:hypothetical protein